MEKMENQEALEEQELLENQKVQGEDEAGKRREARKTPGKGIRRKRKRNSALHALQHIALVMAAFFFITVLAGSYIIVDTRTGTEAYRLIKENKGTFEESEMFNHLLGSSVSDIICYGTIRSQMETDARYDPGKEIDVTAFAGRYGEMPREYITASYYLDDLIKWAQAGFSRQETYMSGEEVDEFLSRSRVVTTVDLSNYSGGTVSYLNSDFSSAVSVRDISGNLLENGDIERDEVNATVLKNRYHTVEGKNIEDYVSSWDEYYELCNNVEKAAGDLSINYKEYTGYKEYYDSGDSNVVYFIRKTIGGDTQIFTNMKTDARTVSDLKKELLGKCDRYVFYDAEEVLYDTNTLIEESTLRYILNGYEYAYPEDTQIMIGVDSGYGAADGFAQAKAGFGNYVPYMWQYLLAGVVCLVVYLFLLAILTLKEGRGRRRNTGEVSVSLLPEDYIPTEIMILAAALVFAGLFYGIRALAEPVWHLPERMLLIVFTEVATLLVSLLFSFFYYSFVRRTKAGMLWRGSILRRMGRTIKKGSAYAYRNSTLLMRVLVPFGGFTLLNLVCMYALCRMANGGEMKTGGITAGMIILLTVDGVVGYLLYNSAVARQKILEGIELICEGDISHQVKEEGMRGDELVLARAVNSIGDSVRAAVETSMKDERLKADLITNVSHDIKTPLTSIINYVDLIKRENIENPKVREYISVLDAKSQRLKQLTDDLVEASKISSGNIVLHWEKINLVELLNQTIGEFSEKFEEKSLYPVFRTTKNFMFIEADSRSIWRVIENLFNNIFKYALAGTRVYIDLASFKGEDEARHVVLSIKNISAQPLKVNPGELTERFIRGDESRTTEGSGLGLSIAKNLTEAQKGAFEIVMDGDLFKVNLVFPLLEEK
ncbi:sensor histidine kinase [bacterium 1xD8-48]|nr:HAMP domain-containing histidine kinase [Lachnospiraceae bacterium]NBJ97390.1 sensor histidine kinase [bacterium 1xD8-48]